MRTVLLFAHECAPYHRAESTVGAQRPAQLAKYLPEFGWRAIVICRDADRQGTAGSDYEESIEREVVERLAGTDPRSSVVIPTPSLPFDGALDRAWRWAAERGNGAFARTFRKTLTAAKLWTGDYSQNWQPCARVAAQVVQLATRIDVCVGEHSPDAGLFLARSFASRFGVPWVVDFRDPILQPLTPIMRKIYRPIARRLVATAATTVTVNQHWAELDGTLFGLPSVSIPNGFDPSEFDAVDIPHDREHVAIAYVGNIHGHQDLTQFLSGLALARSELGERARLLLFKYRGLMHKQVRQMVQQAGVGELCDIGGYVPRADALRDQRSADHLLLLSISHAANIDPHFARGFYPAKTFEYFGARRPIICVPGDRGLLDELIAETRTGEVCRTPADVCRLLVSAIRLRQEGRDLPYAPDASAVERFTRRSLAGRFAAVLDDAAGGEARISDSPRDVDAASRIS